MTKMKIRCKKCGFVEPMTVPEIATSDPFAPSNKMIESEEAAYIRERTRQPCPKCGAVLREYIMEENPRKRVY